MAKRAIKIVPLASRNFFLKIVDEPEHYCTGYDRESVWVPARKRWYVQCAQSCAQTEMSTDMEAYRQIKRVWRKSREDFDSACRFMDFNNLFSNAGMAL